MVHDPLLYTFHSESPMPKVVMYLCSIRQYILRHLFTFLLRSHSSSHPSQFPVAEKHKIHVRGSFQFEEAFSSRNSSSMTGMQLTDKVIPISGYRSLILRETWTYDDDNWKTVIGMEWGDRGWLMGYRPDGASTKGYWPAI